MRKMKRKTLVFITLFLILTTIFAWFTIPALAVTPNSEWMSENYQHGDNCTVCHGAEGFTGVTENGETISLGFDHETFASSIHYENGITCNACHIDQRSYPHRDEEQIGCLSCHNPDGSSVLESLQNLVVELPYESLGEIRATHSEACERCHDEEFQTIYDSVHTEIFEHGNVNAPVCSSCHGSHDITSPNQPRTDIAEVCSTCHLSVYTTYQTSIHGRSLENDNNLDVPSCTDCHGVHDIQGPSNFSFRNESIEICGGCHGDAELMSRYGISSNVFETYLDDFHGRTANLMSWDPNGSPSNKAVCYDCHGIHNIMAVDDPNSSVYPDNLQDTCQQCHEDASITFPEAWLSHYSPSLEETPVLYVVNIIYPILIVGTIGGFVFYIALDMFKRWDERRKGIGHHH